MELSGAQLDLATMSSQPRTAPIKACSNGGTFGQEHFERASELQMVYDALQDNLTPTQTRNLNAVDLDIDALLSDAYKEHLAKQLVQATGLKSSMVNELWCNNSRLLRRFSETVMELAQLRNDGDTNADKHVIEDIACVDVFNVLRQLPSTYFDSPKHVLESDIVEFLCPIYQGRTEERATKKDTVARCSKRLANLYDTVMTNAEALFHNHYDSPDSMQRSIAARAQFENAPLDKLYRAKLNQELLSSIAAYDHHQDVATLKNTLNHTICASLRNAESLLRQGDVRPIKDGYEVEKRVIDGITYSIQAINNGKRSWYWKVEPT